MKKIILLCFLLISTSLTFAQAISYGHLQQIFKSWMLGKGNNAHSITTQLKAMSPKWRISSYQSNGDSNEKYFVWTAMDTPTDTSAIALYIEKDDSTVKYSLRYAFHNAQQYHAFDQSLRASMYYKGNITTQTDNSKGQTELYGHPNESLPLNQRFDMILTDYNLSSSGNQPRLYSVDLWSRYIPIN